MASELVGDTPRPGALAKLLGFLTEVVDAVWSSVARLQVFDVVVNAASRTSNEHGSRNVPPFSWGRISEGGLLPCQTCSAEAYRRHEPEPSALAKPARSEPQTYVGNYGHSHRAIGEPTVGGTSLA